jgi:hypothetical protein
MAAFKGKPHWHVVRAIRPYFNFISLNGCVQAPAGCLRRRARKIRFTAGLPQVIVDK